MNLPDSFDGMLEDAWEIDPRVLADARRLRRFWVAGQPPPTYWTLRWLPPAMDRFFAWAGVDTVRREKAGGHRVSMQRLVDQSAPGKSLEESLDRFLRSHEPSSRPANDDQPREFFEKTDCPETRRWLKQLFGGGRILTELEKPEVNIIARALDLIFGQRELWNVSVLGARAGGGSKFFRRGSRGRRRLADALLFLRGMIPAGDDDREAVLDETGIVGSETSTGVLVAGSLTVDGMDYPTRLADKNQAVFLTVQNLVRPAAAPSVEGVLTIENDAPFMASLKEGLHQKWLLAATGGFANRAVVDLLKRILSPALPWRHWGDTDLAGVRIARVLAERVGYRPTFYRCGPDDIRARRARLLPLDVPSKRAIATDLKNNPNALGSEILRTVLQEGGWLEQEAWQSNSASSPV
ncbi:MAG: DUF2399 domain-containing protein [Elusimicrobia bacterium]|nr:DUF2399 domain-containing protein [Elusimicrobiota bacterium]